MTTVAWMLAIWLAGFISGYALRSYVSARRRSRARRGRYEVFPTRRTLSPVGQDGTIEAATAPDLAPEESSSIVPENVARADQS